MKITQNDFNVQKLFGVSSKKSLRSEKVARCQRFSKIQIKVNDFFGERLFQKQMLNSTIKITEKIIIK